MFCGQGRGPLCAHSLVVMPSGSRFSAPPERGSRTPRSRSPAAEPARRAHEPATKNARHRDTRPWKGVSVSIATGYRTHHRGPGTDSQILRHACDTFLPRVAYLRTGVLVHGMSQPSFFPGNAPAGRGGGTWGCSVVVPRAFVHCTAKVRRHVRMNRWDTRPLFSDASCANRPSVPHNTSQSNT